MSFGLGISSPLSRKQDQQTPAWLRGFDQVAWKQHRPESAADDIKKRLQNKTRKDVQLLLGEPDTDHPAGEGMFGHYDAFYAYTLDRELGVHSQRYVWDTLDISFAPTGTVSKIEVRSHCY